ncbi:hypothetical protein [Nocardioides sp. AX2bis]|uniref:hypothetical protein n=1 Tax=Nocardioides sp. AX2bis TaxID=2653157 RepID=UPI0012F1272F|nr:hypothetical protein [Nocardioides sp. AX2bis]VXC07207.1 conserved hypothetical protein [Nocardioides sp. AX2bis]
MTEQGQDRPDGTGAHYDVVLLVEQALSAADASQVRSLHVGIEEQVRYHLVLPVEDAALRVEAALGSMSTGEVLSPPAAPMADVDVDAVREQTHHRAASTLATSTAALEGAGAVVGTSRAVDEEPVDALTAVIEEVGGQEAIVLTRPHLVAEFFHVDWASQARRHLGIPVLHLVEHETFDEQTGGPEGVTGF